MFDLLIPNCHQMLLVHDILHLVFESITAKSSLSAASRTCRAWREPALDILWRDMTVKQILDALTSEHCTEETWVSEIVSNCFLSLT